jgi:hypothetical protein
MNRLVLTIVAIGLGPLLSGCCCCGSSMNCGGYNGCMPYEANYSSCGGCNNCQNDTFSLPPEGTSFPAQTGVANGTWSNGTWYGPETMGPEIVGPQYVPNGSEYPVAPPVPGSNTPVTPAGPNALLPPAPVPGISNGSVVIPAPAPPYSAASNSATTSGPMMPPVPPPPPEPISQMRFRQYR